MVKVMARATTGPHEPFVPTMIDRRDVGPTDVLIDILHAGICHSDIHHARNDYGRSIYPLVPGHEIAGVVAAVGSDVTQYILGDRVGVGCMIDSCGTCARCLAGEEQYCKTGYTPSAASVDRAGEPTQGGYSRQIVVDQRFVLNIPETLSLDRAAPLLCAGITLYSPMKHWNVGPDTRLAIVGFGGLGHVGVQLAKALGAHVTVLDLSLDKEEDGLALGADAYIATTSPDAFADLQESFDLIISTVPAALDLDQYFDLLDVDGTMVLIGAPDGMVSASPFSFLRRRRSLAGTLIGGTRETQEMLDFCGIHGISAWVETITADQIDDAYERVLRGDVRYRFVIDTTTMLDD